MKASANRLCTRCKWGARVADKGQCGCPGVTPMTLEQYAAFKGYDLDYEMGLFLWRMEAETDTINSAFDYTERLCNTVLAAMVLAADELGHCNKYRARTHGKGDGKSDRESDVWSIYRRKGGEE